MHDPVLILAGALLAMAAVLVGAAVAGLPNKSMQTRLDRLMDQQETQHRRALDLLLANGDVPTFTALTRSDVAAPPAVVASMTDADEAAFWRQRHEGEVSYDSTDDIPEHF